MIAEIADYVVSAEIRSEEAYRTARYCLFDSLACAFMALRQPECTALLGPVILGTVVPDGPRVPGTAWVLDPVRAAFNLGCMIRWLDFNDTWLAAEWGHPSDNLGAILSVADWASRQEARRSNPMTMRVLFTTMIKAYEIQGVLALENAFNRVGLDHVLLVRVASTAVATMLLGGTREQVVTAVSNAWVDGGNLRVHRHAPNVGWRKSWAAGDATSRGVWLAMMALRGETGYPSALSTSDWGFSDVFLKGQPVVVSRAYGSYVMENILFKISYPAEFHGQTAVEAAVQLHPHVKDRLNRIQKVTIWTHEPARRIIDKTGPLHNAADRDHCLQYMVAVALIFGDLTSAHYEALVASDRRIDDLRMKMVVIEDAQFSSDYLDPEKRSIANAVQVEFRGGATTEKVGVEYPLGHRRRRSEAIPKLIEKFRRGLRSIFPAEKAAAIEQLCGDDQRLEALPVSEFVDLLVVPERSS